MERVTVITQGDIYLVNLGRTEGHEQAGIRPAIVIQANPLNRSLSTVIAIPLTANLRGKGFMTTHFIPKESSGLKKDSVALLYQIKALDKTRFIKKIGHIDQDTYFEIRFKLIQNIWWAI